MCIIDRYKLHPMMLREPYTTFLPRWQALLIVAAVLLGSSALPLRFAANRLVLLIALVLGIGVTSVSYTHLTLPPSDLVEISVVAVSFKKKKKKSIAKT